MRLEVAIPAGRPVVQRALKSLASQTMLPDLVTLVGNDPALLQLDSCGLSVRVLRYVSRVYYYGPADISLARNIGAWWAREPRILCFDDDQVAPSTMLADVAACMADAPFAYGHYRYLPFGDRSVESIMCLPADIGRPREHPPNAWHLYYSGYTGLLACDTQLLRSVGWDMITNGTGAAGEDQNLAYRLIRATGGDRRLFVHEPPFAWHPEEREPLFAGAVTNACGPDLEAHAWDPEQEQHGVRWRACRRCPYTQLTYQPDPGRPMVILPFDPRAVDIEESYL